MKPNKAPKSYYPLPKEKEVENPQEEGTDEKDDVLTWTINGLEHIYLNCTRDPYELKLIKYLKNVKQERIKQAKIEE